MLSSAGENEGVTEKKFSPPAVVFDPPPEDTGGHQEGPRLPKTSLPARMSDLYQVVHHLNHLKHL